MLIYIQSIAYTIYYLHKYYNRYNLYIYFEFYIAGVKGKINKILFFHAL